MSLSQQYKDEFNKKVVISNRVMKYQQEYAGTNPWTERRKGAPHPRFNKPSVAVDEHDYAGAALHKAEKDMADKAHLRDIEQTMGLKDKLAVRYPGWFKSDKANRLVREQKRQQKRLILENAAIEQKLICDRIAAEIVHHQKTLQMQMEYCADKNKNPFSSQHDINIEKRRLIQSIAKLRKLQKAHNTAITQHASLDQMVTDMDNHDTERLMVKTTVQLNQSLKNLPEIDEDYQLDNVAEAMDDARDETDTAEGISEQIADSVGAYTLDTFTETADDKETKAWLELAGFAEPMENEARFQKNNMALFEMNLPVPPKEAPRMKSNARQAQMAQAQGEKTGNGSDDDDGGPSGLGMLAN